jgi:hypothetical protein
MRNHSIKRRHYLDAAVILVPSMVAYAYYNLRDLDRLSYVSDDSSILIMAVSFAALCASATIILSMKTHSKLTFAPIPAIVIFLLFGMDYVNPLFPYVPGSPVQIVLLVAGTSVLVFFFWLGLEVVIESKSRFRAIPLGMLLPALTLLVFAVLAGPSLRTHQIIYRTFDLADLSLAMGVGIALAHFKNRPKSERFVVFGILCALLVTFPFGYATSGLLGIRHDTQLYEVEALTWIDGNLESYPRVESDERLAYLSMALYDYEKRPFLPSKLVDGSILGSNTVFILEGEWMTEGVNDYPNGHPVIDEQSIDFALAHSDVLYCAGPSSNTLIVFVNSSLAWSAVP